jgi:hypothetical protein
MAIVRCRKISSRIGGSTQVAISEPAGQASEAPTTVGELLERVGVNATKVEAEELSHNRWLSPGVWRIRTREERLAVLKYTTSD